VADIIRARRYPSPGQALAAGNPVVRAITDAARGPQNAVTRYPIGHFAIYVGEDWERAVADQPEFLVRTLKP
jgi:hypothetical protein